MTTLKHPSAFAMRMAYFHYNRRHHEVGIVWLDSKKRAMICGACRKVWL